jgi:hypothetical protein
VNAVLVPIQTSPRHVTGFRVCARHGRGLQAPRAGAFVGFERPRFLLCHADHHHPALADEPCAMRGQKIDDGPRGENADDGIAPTSSVKRCLKPHSRGFSTFGSSRDDLDRHRGDGHSRLPRHRSMICRTIPRAASRSAAATRCWYSPISAPCRTITSSRAARSASLVSNAD